MLKVVVFADFQLDFGILAGLEEEGVIIRVIFLKGFLVINGVRDDWLRW